MGYFLDNVQMTVASAPGTGAIALGSAVSGFQTFASAGVANGQLVSYAIQDAAGAYEFGRGTYSTTGPTLTRTAILGSSNSGAAITATAAALVTATLLAEDLQDVPGVRQTVQQGPGGGSPSFLPATSASLSITSQNISSSAPLVVSAAGGFGVGGQIDALGWTTSNLTWSSLAASNTNYLGVTVNFGALTTFATTLQPIYQYGGSISVTNGQYTFDIAQMKMFLGNGSVANQVSAVFVGEAVAGASTVTSTVAYAYNGVFISALQAVPSASSSLSLNHNLGVGPIGYKSEWTAVCVTANNGYSAGDELPFDGGVTGSGSLYVAASNANMTRNTAQIAISNTAFGESVPQAGGAVGALTPADWNFRLYVQRRF